mmetsp:Transcript_11331/g.14184  ORF Transcript_11331/g.14184 Transcript_11331/m.14184 type:complete len:99 (+) Transcript_11331:98-394(+)
MNRLRMFGIVKVIKDETITCSTWPKATLMRKVGFIDRTSGSFYPTEGIIQSVDENDLKICLLNDTTEPIRVGDLVVMKSGTDLGTASGETRMPPFGFQ